MYKVFLERRAEHDLEVLDRKIRERVIALILFLRKDPRANSKKLIGSKNVWRARVGDWRIIYEINDGAEEVRVYRIKHRGKAYIG